MCEIKKLYGYKGANPFLGINGRDFSDEAIKEEFCPTSQFWSLFTNQHEILLGTRGSGKTFLLKSMRRSMLQSINLPDAKRIITEKKYIAFYIALQMERMANLENINRNESDKILLFQFIFNSCLAISIISEAKKRCIDTEQNDKQQALLNNTNLADRLYKIWFNTKSNNEIIDLDDLSVYINSIYYNFNFNSDSIDILPHMFIGNLCAPLISANETLSTFWDAKEPTWILAIDEAEFVDALYQKTINSFMRSNPMHVILKIATLPYYWKTLETLDKDIEISIENDFKYTVLDMDCDDADYVALTNKLCSNRLQRIHFEKTTIDSSSLEKLVGTVGNDKRMAYFVQEMGGDITIDDIYKGILEQLSPTRKSNSASKKDIKQEIYKKYAPIFYVREVYKKKKGKYIPKWFAGSEVIRKVSQGNPRMFLNLMTQIFTYATTNKNFDLKDQHRIITHYAHDVYEATKAIEKNGKEIYDNLSIIANQLHSKTHDDYLKEVGCSFTFAASTDLEKEQKWIQRAISFSRLSVDKATTIHGISNKTKFVLCNAFAVEYWLTMRSDYPTIISLTGSTAEESKDEKYDLLSFL